MFFGVGIGVRNLHKSLVRVGRGSRCLALLKFWPGGVFLPCQSFGRADYFRVHHASSAKTFARERAVCQSPGLLFVGEKNNRFKYF
jgi:hypothetical protein